MRRRVPAANCVMGAELFVGGHRRVFQLVRGWFKSWEVLIGNYSAYAMGYPWSYFSFDTSKIPGGGRITDTTLGFKLSESPAGKYVAFPYWFPMFLLALL